MYKPLPQFTICLQCKPCGSGCLFLDNNISFIKDNQTRRVSRVIFDSSMAACNGQCGYDCVTKFKLTKTIKDK